LWLSLRMGGVHATFAGVVMGLLAPTKPSVDPDLMDGTLIESGSVREVMQASRMVRSSISVVERLEYRLHGWSSYLIVPIFALANAGIQLSFDSIRDSMTSTVGLGVFAGLLLGKPLGILIVSGLAVWSGVAALPTGVGWRALTGAGVIAGIGFTVSIFVAELALDPAVLNDAKVGVVAASVIGGGVGLVLLRMNGETQD
jgi:NhaA family Na+:H+ antiporter